MNIRSHRAKGLIARSVQRLRDTVADGVVLQSSYLGVGLITDQENDSLYLLNKWAYTPRYI